MPHLIIANWKMNPQTLAEAKAIFESVKKARPGQNRRIEAVVCPPLVYIPVLKPTKNLNLGAQNCFWQQKGAFTGEVSPNMLKKLGCCYVIVGHSERRREMGETDEIINKKIKAVISAGLKPIFCTGESERERNQGKTFDVLRSQINKGIKGVQRKEVKNVVIAYEPVWAIGTGKNCETEEALRAVLFIKKLLAKLYGQTVSDNVPILYGGSVNSGNAADYTEETEINGLLVGGASLKAEEFIGILNKVGRT